MRRTDGLTALFRGCICDIQIAPLKLLITEPIVAVCMHIQQPDGLVRRHCCACHSARSSSKLGEHHSVQDASSSYPAFQSCQHKISLPETMLNRTTGNEKLKLIFSVAVCMPTKRMYCSPSEHGHNAKHLFQSTDNTT
jgi:hypothetical protein